MVMVGSVLGGAVCEQRAYNWAKREIRITAKRLVSLELKLEMNRRWVLAAASKLGN